MFPRIVCRRIYSIDLFSQPENSCAQFPSLPIPRLTVALPSPPPPPSVVKVVPPNEYAVPRHHVLRFRRTYGPYHFFFLSSSIAIHFPLIIRRYIGLPLSFLLIPYHPYRRSSLALSSSAFPITLSWWLFLSCTIHQSTKQCYCTLGLCPLASVALPARSHLQVYKLYHYFT